MLLLLLLLFGLSAFCCGEYIVVLLLLLLLCAACWKLSLTLRVHTARLVRSHTSSRSHKGRASSNERYEARAMPETRWGVSAPDFVVGACAGVAKG